MNKHSITNREEIMVLSMVIAWFLLPVAIAMLIAYRIDGGYFEVPPRKIRKEIERDEEASNHSSSGVSVRSGS